MRMLPSDPDIQTIVSRINSGHIDLQPDFQRGEVWSISKKQKLIDSILREWHIPPVHVIVEPETNIQLVLDGQQRLAAVRDFVRGVFSVDGEIEPHDAAIASLHGLSCDALPSDVKNRFEQFTFRVFRIVDYSPAEPAELFYRLNQPSTLTSAEQRNAFVGAARRQVKDLVSELSTAGLDKSFWGFSNLRMAYDDVIARSLLLLERGNLWEKTSSAALTNKYRSNDAFDESAFRGLQNAIRLFRDARQGVSGGVWFNKATAQTWLVFAAVAASRCGEAFDAVVLADFLAKFNSARAANEFGIAPEFGNDHYKLEHPVVERLLTVYEDRSSARVADTASVILRDLVVWALYGAYSEGSKHADQTKKARDLLVALHTLGSIFSVGDLERHAVTIRWGTLR